MSFIYFNLYWSFGDREPEGKLQKQAHFKCITALNNMKTQALD